VHLAARRNQTSAVAELGAAGADLNATTALGSTALHYAAALGHVKMVELLVGLGVDVLVRDLRGRSALWYAAAGGHAELLRLLLLPATSPFMFVNDLPCRDGLTPLAAAMLHGREDAARVLLADPFVAKSVRENLDGGNGNNVGNAIGNNMTNTGNHTFATASTPLLHCAVLSGVPALVALALELTASAGDVNAVDGRGRTALSTAAERGLVPIVSILLDCVAVYPSFPECDDRMTPLHRAARAGHLEVARLLVARKDALISLFSTCAAGFLPVDHATTAGHAGVASFLEGCARLHAGTPL
jgi:ankyrin repeat protein